MTTRSFKTALSGALLALGGCVVAPPPVAVLQQNCRQFTQTIIVDGHNQLGYGLECLQPNGTWQIVTTAGPTPPTLPPPLYVPYDYGPYDYGYPWYFGPEIGIGIGVGRGWHGGGGRGGGHGGGGRGGGHGGGGHGGGHR